MPLWGERGGHFVTFLMPYSRDDFASVSVNCPNDRFSLGYSFVSAEPAIALASLLCYYLFRFDKHSVFSVEGINNLSDWIGFVKKKVYFISIR